MNLIKWIRKNERKIMAIVVVLLMVGFIGGSYISQLGQGGWGKNAAVATYGANGKITLNDRFVAQNELEALRSMGAERLLHSQDLRGLFLSELLFSENKMSPEMLTALKRLIATKGLRISDEQIRKLYQQTAPTDIYWILLKKETQNAGIAVDTQTVREILTNAVPQLFPNTTYAQMMENLVRRGLSQDLTESAFANLFAILEYSQLICSEQPLTENQLTQAVSMDTELINTEFVRFPWALFADERPNPNEEQISLQFEKYRDNLPGEFSEENPYGFGYKLDDMAVLEYIAVKLDDIAEIVEPPTQQEKEDYYQRNREQFTRQIPLDPNNPNSLQVERVASFGQVAKLITDRLTQQRIMSKSDTIMGEAKRLIQQVYGETNISQLEPNELKAADYQKIANQLTEKHKITVHYGTTGFLSTSDMRADTYLAGLFLQNPSAGQMPIPLYEAVFSIEQFGGSQGLMDISPPRLYETIGPVRDIRGKVAAVLRVVDTKKSYVPDSLKESFSKTTIDFKDSEKEKDKVYSVRENVIEDLKNLAAMNTAKQKSEEFSQIAQSKSWDEALNQFNKRYPPKDSDEPNSFRLVSLSNFNRIGPAYIEALDFRSQSETTARFVRSQSIKQNKVAKVLYSLIPADSNQAAELPLIVSVEPDISYYVIKGLSVNRLYDDDFQAAKSRWAFELDALNMQNLAVVFFQPDNIIKRMNLQFVKDDNTTPQEAEASPEGVEL